MHKMFRHRHKRHGRRSLDRIQNGRTKVDKAFWCSKMFKWGRGEVHALLCCRIDVEWSAFGCRINVKWSANDCHLCLSYSTCGVPLASMGLLADAENCGWRMRRECRECFLRHWLRRKPLVSDPCMHQGTCVTHVPWCMSGSLTRRVGAWATRNFAYLVRSPFSDDCGDNCASFRQSLSCHGNRST